MFGGPPPDPGFGEAFDRLFPQACSLAYDRLGDQKVAEATASEALARAYARWPKLAFSPGLDDWVLGTTSELAAARAGRTPHTSRASRDRAAPAETAAPAPEVALAEVESPDSRYPFDLSDLFALTETPIPVEEPIPDEEPIPVETPIPVEEPIPVKLPERGRAELMDPIERRGLALRRRRRTGRRMASAACCLAMIVALVLIATNLSGSGRTSVAADASSTRSSMDTSTTALTTTAAPSVSEATPTSTTAPPSVTPTTLIVARPQPREPVSTTEAPPPEPQCGGAQLVATISTDSASYMPGQRISMNSVVANRSASSCYYASYSASILVRGPGGEQVGNTQMIHGDNFEYLVMPPDQTFTQSGGWDQCGSTMPCVQAPPGLYAATVKWQFTGTPVEASTSFTLAAPVVTATAAAP